MDYSSKISKEWLELRRDSRFSGDCTLYLNAKSNKYKKIVLFPLKLIFFIIKLRWRSDAINAFWAGALTSMCLSINGTKYG